VALHTRLRCVTRRGLRVPSFWGGQPMATETTECSFDELTRGLASGTLSRGRALRLMGAAVVGGALASLGIGEAAADPPGCKRNGKVCTKDKVCCSGNCEDGTCQPAGTQFTCICGLTQTFQTCSSAPCDENGLSAVCTPLCEQHGSVYTGGNCSNVPCVV